MGLYFPVALSKTRQTVPSRARGQRGRKYPRAPDIIVQSVGLLSRPRYLSCTIETAVPVTRQIANMRY